MATKKRVRGTGPEKAEVSPADNKSSAPHSGGREANGHVTPSMAQFLEIKAANPDCLLFYRMGDFYELFFEDAIAASRALGIVLTKRGKHYGEDIPMCGVPVHRADEYLQRLIKSGFRVAVCEQLENPAEARKRGPKAIVHRDVVRLVTPGTLTEDSLLDAKAANFLTALFVAPTDSASATPRIAHASLDISTGDFQVGEARDDDLAGELARILPSEVLTAERPETSTSLYAAIEVIGAALTPIPSAHFDSQAGKRDLMARLGVATLDAFGEFSRIELAAVGALLKYVELTQIGMKPVLRPPRKVGPQTTLTIDAASRSSLELMRTSSGDRHGSLLSAVDRTVTGAGGRELAARLASPLRDADEISHRLDAVEYLRDDETMRAALRETLRAAPDIARAISRLAFARGGPRDLAAIRDGFSAAIACAGVLNSGPDVLAPPEGLKDIAKLLHVVDLPLKDQLAEALIDDPPHLKRDGGFIRAGYRDDLDDARRLRDESRSVIAGLQETYRESTTIKTLKVRHNNILGYFIEVSAGQATALTTAPLNETFRHRQTMANAMRFTTPELSETEGRISSAAARALAIEQDIFTNLAEGVAEQRDLLGTLAHALATLDVHAGLADLASEDGYCRPVLDNSFAFSIIAGRHPVVEQALKRADGSSFIENDCVLIRPDVMPEGFDDDVPEARIWLVTGPNMAGKSTFLRQNAVITVLAQMGAFVPARSVHIGIVDRLFSRVGASDDLARGRSTFMVEMVETAGILNQASEHSLVILDEIGRGTATFDGLSIAWATLEHLHDVNGARVLFATHYHELTALTAKLNSLANVTADVKEWADEIVFMHKIVAGAADRSYGIQVAKLAGLPAIVTQRAGEVLALLEDSDRKDGAAQVLDDLPLFAATRPNSYIQRSTDIAPSPAENALTQLNPDEFSPRAALEELYRLKDLACTKPPEGSA